MMEIAAGRGNDANTFNTSGSSGVPTQSGTTSASYISERDRQQSSSKLHSTNAAPTQDTSKLYETIQSLQNS
ncbi:hypothetical protein HDU76_013878 [Blyttiomyces sp. JEL0837]|nr:hypothetical protein HDU76_013878 [Blyttiomyces sp. JEL0837]